ncbi:TMEM175 family protein [Lactococcus allomyrinae]|uniref:DUF1211 domain-containing protein n=1 Tax=Lactococcus allomyrinae TaxID=2419773 RepID=A0A387BFJ6_9LACT|nr:TMEM175 family protein [Lactococcus allomyrinae]AYG00902.1 DUF1211 domain-containing protein [Lactococcus allomyrinae]
MNKKRKVAVYEGHMVSPLKSFTDAVMSIIATIMVLEIPLPMVLRGGHYDFSKTISSLIIFFVSFLVVVSYYFQFTKFFSKVHKLSGWQIFTYIIFLMLVSLFPLMTQVDNASHPGYFMIIYILYIVGISRLASWIIDCAYRLNGIKRIWMMKRVPWDLMIMTALSIGLSFTGIRQVSGYVLMYLPIRSLISSIVYDENEEK